MLYVSVPSIGTSLGVCIMCTFSFENLALLQFCLLVLILWHEFPSWKGLKHFHCSENGEDENLVHMYGAHHLWCSQWLCTLRSGECPLLSEGEHGCCWWPLQTFFLLNILLLNILLKQVQHLDATDLIANLQALLLTSLHPVEQVNNTWGLSTDPVPLSPPQS